LALIYEMSLLNKPKPDSTYNPIQSYFQDSPVSDRMKTESQMYFNFLGKYLTLQKVSSKQSFKKETVGFFTFFHVLAEILHGI